MTKVGVSAIISSADKLVLETFVGSYLPDMGIQVQMLEALCKDMDTPSIAASDMPKVMLTQALTDVGSVGSMFSTPEYDFDTVEAGAASLDFLVRCARKVDRRVIPEEVIPKQEVVDTLLKNFNANKMALK